MEDWEPFMREAIAEARKSMGATHPNPAVGAVLVHDGRTVARGHTEPPGGRHAERVALEAFQAMNRVPNASTTLVVTLEPCSTEGRTGACTRAIEAAGIPHVVIGTIDPNPAHNGAGVEHLNAAGIRVTTGVLEQDCRDLNLIFHWRMTTGLPFFAGKVATTLDGRIATRGGLSRWITGPESREDVHFWRRYFPAIAVGAGTILADNPVLTARLPGAEPWCPVRFVFDRNLVTFREELPLVYTDAYRERTIVVTNRSRLSQVEQLEQTHGLRFWTLEDNPGDGGLAEFTERCLGEGIDGLLLEGGGALLSAFLKGRHLHYLFAYRAPKLLGDSSGLVPFSGLEPVSMDETVRLTEVRHSTFGEDQLMRGFLVYPSE